MAETAPRPRLVDALLSGEEDPAALGLFRICFVFVLLVGTLLHVGSVTEYFSAEADVGGVFAREAFPSRWSLFFHFDEPWIVVTIFTVGLVAHVTWMLGLYTRVSGVLSVLLWMSMYGRNPLLYAFPDQFMYAMAFLLALMPAGRGLSLDASWRGKAGKVPVWCRRILQLQIALLYTGSALMKTGATWVSDGTAIYYTVVNPYNRHFDIGGFYAAIQPYVLRPSTYLVVAWETAFAGFVLLHWLREVLASYGIRRRWFADLRFLFLGFGVLFHVGIQVAVYVILFSPVCIASYTAFLTPQDARRITAAIRRKVLRSST